MKNLLFAVLIAVSTIPASANLGCPPPNVSYSSDTSCKGRFVTSIVKQYVRSYTAAMEGRGQCVSSETLTERINSYSSKWQAAAAAKCG